MLELKVYDNVEKPSKRGMHKVSTGKSSKYRLSELGIGQAIKVVFTSTDVKAIDKEVRNLRTAVIGFQHRNEQAKLETWTVTAEQAEQLNDPEPGAGIWVKRANDLTSEEVAKRVQTRLAIAAKRDAAKAEASATA